MFGKIKRYEAFQLLFEEQETDVPPTLAFSLTRKYFIIIIFLYLSYVYRKKKVTLYCDETEQQLCARGEEMERKKKSRYALAKFNYYYIILLSLIWI